jgi:hypothetical protein
MRVPLSRAAAALSLCALALARAGLASPFAPAFHRGIVFGAGEWSSPDATYDSPQALASLQALAATGASHVRLLVSGYLDNTTSATQVYSILPPSALERRRNSGGEGGEPASVPSTYSTPASSTNVGSCTAHSAVASAATSV